LEIDRLRGLGILIRCKVTFGALFGIMSLALVGLGLEASVRVICWKFALGLLLLEDE
jgi:hypothetical protein